MENKEKAAIDKIYEMEEDLKYIKQYVQLIDNNLKLLNNKLGKIEKALENQPVAQPNQKITATPGTPPPPQKERKDSEKLVLGKIKTFGYIVNRTKQPISDIDVQVYDEDNEVVKRRKTDSDGYWEVRLPPGKYGVEYRQEGYRPINKTILLDRTMKSFEVK